MKKIQIIIHDLFLAVITAKTFNAVVQIVGGFLIYFYGKAAQREAFALTGYELTEKHNDFIAKSLLAWAQSFSISVLHFISFYLFFHGVINLFLVYSVYKKKLWAYPLSIVLFSLFLFYQIVHIYHNHSVGLSIVSTVDLFMIILTYLEHKRLKANSSL